MAARCETIGRIASPSWIPLNSASFTMAARLICTSGLICITHYGPCSSLKKISFYCLMKHYCFYWWVVGNYGPFMFILGIVPYSFKKKKKDMCKMPLHFSSYGRWYLRSSRQPPVCVESLSVTECSSPSTRRKIQETSSVVSRSYFI